MQAIFKINPLNAISEYLTKYKIRIMMTTDSIDFPWRPKDKRGQYEITLERHIKYYFPLIYCALIIYALTGMAYQISQLLSVFFGKNRPVKMWRSRYFYGTDSSLVRYFRIIGGLYMIGNWGMLLYGLVMIQSDWITRWLYGSFTFMMLDYIMWCLEVMLKQQPFYLSSLLNFAFPFSVQFLVWRVKILIENSSLPEKRWFF